MTQQQPTEASSDFDEEVARQLLERYRWQLASAEELVEQARRLAGNDASRTTRILVGAYWTILYHAFMGEHRFDRQRRAAEELGLTISNLIARSYPDLPRDEREDVTQSTVLRVWNARTSCREPAAFLAFAASHLLTEVQLTRRRLRRFGETPRSAGEDERDLADNPDTAPSPLDQVLRKEIPADIERFLAEVRLTFPRAVDQIAILELHLREDIDHAEIAERLSISAAIVSTKLSRIRKKIRKNSTLKLRAHELGLL